MESGHISMQQRLLVYKVVFSANEMEINIKDTAKDTTKEKSHPELLRKWLIFSSPC